MSLRAITEHFANVYNLDCLDLISSSDVLERFQKLPVEQLELKGKGLDINFATIGFKVQVSNVSSHTKEPSLLPIPENNTQS